MSRGIRFTRRTYRAAIRRAKRELEAILGGPITAVRPSHLYALWPRLSGKAAFRAKVNLWMALWARAEREGIRL